MDLIVRVNIETPILKMCHLVWRNYREGNKKILIIIFLKVKRTIIRNIF